MGTKAEQYKAEAKAAGLKVVGDGSTSGYLLYQFIECGHIAEKHTSSVRKKSVACKECAKERHAANAFGLGLVLIGRSKKPGYWKYRWMSCRHICEYRPQNLSHKTKCEKCANRWSWQ